MRRHAQPTLPAPAPAPASHHRRSRTGAAASFSRFASWRPGVLLGLAGAVVSVTFLSAGVAFAYFLTSDSSHPALAAAATLSVPGSGQQNGKDKSGAVTISWSAPGGYTPTGYTVSRCSGSSCTSFAPITSGNCSGTLTKTSCTDNDPALAASATYSYEVTAGLDSWASLPGSPFQGTTAGATSMTFTTQPAAGQPIQAAGTGSFDVSVTLQDANGTTDTNDSTDSVTLAIDPSHDPGHGMLTCTGGPTAGVSKGVASFKKCAIDKAGTGYQLTASSTTDSSLAAPANANPFTIIAGNPSQIMATSGGGQSAGTTTAFAQPLAVTVQDVKGNPVPNAPVTFSAPSSGASATFGCTSNPTASSCAATTDGSGVATSPPFTATAKAGSYTITASTPGAGKVTFSETDTANTSVSSLVTADGSGTAGKLGPGDTVTVTFTGPIDPSTVCSAWTNSVTPTASAGSVVTVNGSGFLQFASGPTACGTFRFGILNLETNGYYTPPSDGSKLTFTGSTIAYDGTARTLKITLGATGSSGTQTGTVNAVSASPLQLNLSTGILDAGDNALTGYTYPAASGVQF